MLLLLISLLCSTKSDFIKLDTEIKIQQTVIDTLSAKQDSMEEQIELLRDEISLLKLDNLRQDVELKKKVEFHFTQREKECCLIVAGVTLFALLLSIIK